MAGEKSLYLVIQGDYSDTELAGEVWQTGIRMFASPGGTPDSVGTLSNTWDVVAANLTADETDYTIESNWTVEGGANDLNPLDYLNDQVVPALENWMGNTAISQLARVRFVKLYPIAHPSGDVIPAPPYAQGSPALLTYKIPYPAFGGSTSVLPLQNSIAVSHRTQQTGPRGRGRSFWPAIDADSIGADGTIGQTLREAIAGLQAVLLTDLTLSTDGAGFNVIPAVLAPSRVDYALINQVRVGSVMDTQRRRRNKIVEVYSNEAVPYEA
jgi:hypothetical protein